MFSRSRAAGRRARADRSQRPPAGPPAATPDGAADGTGDGAPDGAADTPPGSAAGSAPTGGPYDVSQAPAGVRRLDLGSLQIPVIEGVEVRVQPGNDGSVRQVVLRSGKSAVQLGVFAAPRSEPIWDEVRADIRESLLAEGATRTEEVDGPYGTELRARIRTKEGPADLRFVGVDGPRWMVRALYRGPAAVDPAKAGPLAESLAGLVVDRGNEARPVKEALPLRLPAELAAKLPEDAPHLPAAGEPPVLRGTGPAGA